MAQNNKIMLLQYLTETGLVLTKCIVTLLFTILLVPFIVLFTSGAKSGTENLKILPNMA